MNMVVVQNQTVSSTKKPVILSEAKDPCTSRQCRCCRQSA